MQLLTTTYLENENYRELCTEKKYMYADKAMNEPVTEVFNGQLYDVLSTGWQGSLKGRGCNYDTVARRRGGENETDTAATEQNHGGVGTSFEGHPRNWSIERRSAML